MKKWLFGLTYVCIVRFQTGWQGPRPPACSAMIVMIIILLHITSVPVPIPGLVFGTVALSWSELRRNCQGTTTSCDLRQKPLPAYPQMLRVHPVLCISFVYICTEVYTVPSLCSFAYSRSGSIDFIFRYIGMFSLAWFKWCVRVLLRVRACYTCRWNWS
jgi:hypothetical protein